MHNKISRQVQGKFNKISIKEGNICFHLETPLDGILNSNSVQINFIHNAKEYRRIHKVLNYYGIGKYDSFAISGYLFDEIDTIIFDDEQSFCCIGVWSMIDDYELSLKSCDWLLVNNMRAEMKKKPNSFPFLTWVMDYIIVVNFIDEIRKNYLVNNTLISKIVNEKLLEKGIDRWSELFSSTFRFNNSFDLSKLARNYVDVSIFAEQRNISENSFIITHSDFEYPYYLFLVLKLKDQSHSSINEILNYHSNKHDNIIVFHHNLKSFGKDVLGIENEKYKSIVDWIEYSNLNRPIKSRYLNEDDLIKTESENTIDSPKRDNVLNKIVNNFNGKKIQEVYLHFKLGLVDSNYFSEDELIEFLIAAFEKQEVPEVLFRLKNMPTKETIYRVFYEYYAKIAGKPHGKQKKYAALLGKYFEGYNTDTVSTSFSKSMY